MIIAIANEMWKCYRYVRVPLMDQTGNFYYILQKFNGLKELTPLSKVEN